MLLERIGINCNSQLRSAIKSTTAVIDWATSRPLSGYASEQGYWFCDHLGTNSRNTRERIPGRQHFCNDAQVETLAHLGTSRVDPTSPDAHEPVETAEHHRTETSNRNIAGDPVQRHVFRCKQTPPTCTLAEHVHSTEDNRWNYKTSTHGNIAGLWPAHATGSSGINGRTCRPTRP